MRSLCFSYSPLYHTLSASSSSSLHSSQSVLLYSFPRNGGERKNRPAKSSMHRDSPNDIVFLKRRAIFLLGISVVPFVQLNAKAFEGLETEGPEIPAAEQEKKSEQAVQGDASQSPFLSILNGLGIFTSGILGALYALARNEKISTEAVIESHPFLTKAVEEKKELEDKMKEKLNSIAFLQERVRLLSLEIKDKEDTLSKQNSSLAEKESELRRLNSTYEKIKNELAGANSEISTLQQEILKNGKELELKNTAANDLNTAANDLKEEKKVVTSLTDKLQALEKQILERKAFEMDLEGATKSLSEMNQKAITLTIDLETAKSQISSLEEERDLIYNFLSEHKRISQEERENLEDAHTIVMSLGKEREVLVKRGKKLEEDLAAAKGEILRLRSVVNSSKSIVNDRHEKKLEAGGNANAAVKKNGRRRGGSPTR